MYLEKMGREKNDKVGENEEKEKFSTLLPSIFNLQVGDGSNGPFFPLSTEGGC